MKRPYAAGPARARRRSASPAKPRIDRRDARGHDLLRHDLRPATPPPRRARPDRKAIRRPTSPPAHLVRRRDRAVRSRRTRTTTCPDVPRCKACRHRSEMPPSGSSRTRTGTGSGTSRSSGSGSGSSTSWTTSPSGRERDPDFRFTMDGQMAAVEDYLEVRPEQRETVRRSSARGQLAIGPWRMLMDEFLCSGETMIRNLEIGRAGAPSARRGRCRRLPAGHVRPLRADAAAAAPRRHRAGRRLARRAGWRSTAMSSGGRRPTAPAIRTEYLAGSYGNAADLFAGPERPPHARAPCASGSPRSSRGWADRLPGDVRHRPRRARCRALMDQVGGAQRRPGRDRASRSRRSTTTSPTTAHRRGSLRVLTGELRSHARANILPGRALGALAPQGGDGRHRAAARPATPSRSLHSGCRRSRRATWTWPGGGSSTPRATTRSPGAAWTRPRCRSGPHRRGARTRPRPCATAPSRQRRPPSQPGRSSSSTPWPASGTTSSTLDGARPERPGRRRPRRPARDPFRDAGGGPARARSRASRCPRPATVPAHAPGARPGALRPRDPGHRDRRGRAQRRLPRR